MLDQENQNYLELYKQIGVAIQDQKIRWTSRIWINDEDVFENFHFILFSFSFLFVIFIFILMIFI